MSYFYIHYSHIPDTPWHITETNKNRNELINEWFVSDVEINAPCKSFVGKFHYFYCQGNIILEGTKAVINPLK